MIDPVVDAEGNTYERSAIELWIKDNGTSPVTRNAISLSDLRPNRSLKNALDEIIAAGKVVPKRINSSDQNIPHNKIPPLTLNISAKKANVDCTELLCLPGINVIQYSCDVKCIQKHS